MTTFASLTIGGRLASSFGVLEASRLPDTLIAGPLRVRITTLFSNNYRNSPGDLIAGFRRVCMATLRRTRHADSLRVLCEFAWRLKLQIIIETRLATNGRTPIWWSIYSWRVLTYGSGLEVAIRSPCESASSPPEGRHTSGKFNKRRYQCKY